MPPKPKATKNHEQISPQQQLLNQMSTKTTAEFNDEWNKLAKATEEFPCEAWKNYKSSPKNRYDSIPCNDNELVKVAGVDFFNGNFIKSIGGQKLFLAGQGPTVDSTEDFWRVVLQEKVGCIVMLCNLYEPTMDKKTKKTVPRSKCAKYWPTTVPHFYDNFEVRAEMVANCSYSGGKEAIMVTQLHIVNSKTKKLIQKVVHVQHQNWTDHGVPGSSEAVMDIFKKYVTPNIKSKTPVFTHCSAGIGRTGVFIGAYYCYDLYLKNQLVSIESATKQLRRMRAKAVQTAEQYIFMQLLMVELIKTDTKDEETKEELEAIQQKLKNLIKFLKDRAAQKKAKNLPPKKTKTQ